MKILYIALKYDYGKPERGFSFEHHNFYDTLVRMNKGEHEVIYFPFDEITIKFGQDEMNRRLLKIAYQEKPDLCFFFLFENEIKKEVIREITDKSGSITFNWFADDHWRFDNFSRYYAPLFTWVSTTDPQAVKKYNKIGYKNVIKTQWACNHFLYKPLDLPKIYDVTFVGQAHGSRKKIIEKIKKSGINIKCWGKGWPAGQISQDKMLRIFSQSKINLNFAESSGNFSVKTIAKIFISKDIEGNLYLNSPRLWLANCRSLIWRKNQIKGRNFEIPGCGGFILTPEVDNLEDYYEKEKEIATFKNENDLINKIRWYLEHDEERERIAHAGYERTLKDHTYEKRFNAIFNQIFTKCKAKNC